MRLGVELPQRNNRDGHTPASLSIDPSQESRLLGSNPPKPKNSPPNSHPRHNPPPTPNLERLKAKS